jgi:sortase (surface protein transpeptidase)
MSLASRLLLARLLVCLSLTLCGFAAVLLLSDYLNSSAVAAEPKQVLPVHATKSDASARGTAPAQSTISPDDPVRLVIPAAGINAPVEVLGVQSNGDLATPTHNPWDEVGWYDLGPRPGERGSAVIDGHLDRPGGYPAVFWRLRDMKVGEDVQVTNTARKMLHFRVTRVAYYASGQAPLQDIFGNQGGAFLNLITCAGDWIPSQHQTTLRLVVYTSLV